jgi:hypothetical protein
MTHVLPPERQALSIPGGHLQEAVRRSIIRKVLYLFISVDEAVEVYDFDAPLALAEQQVGLRKVSV